MGGVNQGSASQSPRANKFCVCLRLRLSCIVFSALTILFGGILTFAIWFEVGSNPDMTHRAMAAFVLAGVLSTILFSVSVFGFIGIVIRKRLFVTIYRDFLYAHFVTNVAVSIFLLWVVSNVANTDVVKACQQSVQNDKTKARCPGLVKVTRGIFLAFAVTVLTLEFCVAICLTRYRSYLGAEKQTMQSARMGHIRHLESGVTLVSRGQTAGLFGHGQPSHGQLEFNPYAELISADSSSSRQPGLERGFGGHLTPVGLANEEKQMEASRIAGTQVVNLSPEISRPTSAIDDTLVLRPAFTKLPMSVHDAPMTANDSAPQLTGFAHLIPFMQLPSRPTSLATSSIDPPSQVNITVRDVQPTTAASRPINISANAYTPSNDPEPRRTNVVRDTNLQGFEDASYPTSTMSDSLMPPSNSISRPMSSATVYYDALHSTPGSSRLTSIALDTSVSPCEALSRPTSIAQDVSLRSQSPSRPEQVAREQSSSTNGFIPPSAKMAHDVPVARNDLISPALHGTSTVRLVTPMASINN